MSFAQTPKCGQRVSPRFTVLAACLAVCLSAVATGDENTPESKLEHPAAELSTAAEPCEIMPVAEVRAGMQGIGKTVLKGTEITTFEATVIGVLHNVSPGRDVVLCKLTGAGLEYSGVIAGMSGSPIYIDNKLMGAVAYTWSFNKEPIAGVTPFEQMRSFADEQLPNSFVISATSDGTIPVSVLDLDRDPFDLFEQTSAAGSQEIALDARGLTPIAIPLSATGFGAHSLRSLESRLARFGVVPIASGGAGDEVGDAHADEPIVAGASLAASLVTGDFDLSGIGTVTHVEGDRVWGWGHPFMGGGRCNYLLRSGFVHLVNPKHDLSTKIGSPLSIHGVVNADVSTCIAGDLNAKADLLPVTISVSQNPSGKALEYHVQIVRHPTLLGPLIATVLSNALEGAGALGQEITVEIEARIQARDMEPIVVQNRYSGSDVAGTKGAMRPLNQVAIIADGLTRNPFQPTYLESIECKTVVTCRRTSATIVAARLNSDRFEPGEQIQATVTLRPYKCEPTDVVLSLDLPESLPPGSYKATICDSRMHLKRLFGEAPQILAARSAGEIADVYRLQLAEKRSSLYLRVVTQDQGVSVGDVSLPELPASARAALTSRRSQPTGIIRHAQVARLPTQWVIVGSASLPFRVVQTKRVSG